MSIFRAALHILNSVYMFICFEIHNAQLMSMRTAHDSGIKAFNSSSNNKGYKTSLNDTYWCNSITEISFSADQLAH